MVGTTLGFLFCLIVLLIGVTAVVTGVVLVTKGRKAVGYGVLVAGVCMSLTIIAVVIWGCVREDTMRTDFNAKKRFEKDFEKWSQNKVQ